VVSVAGIRLGSWKSARSFKGIVCDDVSEFESDMASHAVGLSQVRSPAAVMQARAPLAPLVRTWPAGRGAAPERPSFHTPNIVVAETSMVKSMGLTFQTLEFTHSLLGHAA
jgi:hypothetical protein